MDILVCPRVPALLQVQGWDMYIRIPVTLKMKRYVTPSGSSGMSVFAIDVSCMRAIHLQDRARGSRVKRVRRGGYK